ncbi:MAG TPA: ATP-binding protein [Candidatus Eisenbacteria bacterium]|nr:ATP-binding protein [Candidatus Eisenbacteria bacterium]
MRDRSKRRKQQTENQGQDQPAPLQPRFPESIPDDIGNRIEPQEYEPQSAVPEESDEQVSQPFAQTSGGEEPPQGFRRDRNRRRGRRGRGGRPQQANQAPTLPAPGGLTGEAAEADATPDVAEPVAAAVRPPAPHEARKSKGAVVLSIGLPGSGKSTWFKRHNILPLSSDMVRILLFDDVTEQRYQDLVFSTLRSMLRARLLAKRPWNYVDATNLSPHERRSWIKLAHDFGYETHAVFFDVPPEVCIERNRRRERNVPEDVMLRMANKLRPPKFEEGFAKITVVRLKKKDGEPPAEESRAELPIAPDQGEAPEPVEPIDRDY